MLDDQQTRDQFQNVLSENYSVIASPGTGKTTAITHRIANIICSCRVPETLKTFLAVTYTEKAANEIKERVTKQVLTKIEQNSAPHYSTIGLNNMFFGTIHSLCANLLRKYGTNLSIKEDFEIIEDDSKYWKLFTQNCDFLKNLGEIEQQILPYFAIDKILDDAHDAKPCDCQNLQLTQLNEEAINNLLNYPTTGREIKIKNFQNDLKIWKQIGQNCPIPPLPKTASQAFAEFLSKNANDFTLWQERAYDHLVNVYANRYQRFRISNNVLTYDDLINLALKLLTKKIFYPKQIPNYRIILDEAQDTDPDQFKILIALANKKCYEKIFENNDVSLDHRKFSFSMVGDPKQSIYSDRADVNFYMLIHNKLVQSKLLHPLNFNITMRCSQEIVSFVNKKFSTTFAMFSDKPMQAHPQAKYGSVEIIKADTNCGTLSEVLNKNFSIGKEIEQYSDIAILAPRKAWLSEIAIELQRTASMRFQLWSNENIADQPSLIKWAAAILHYLLSPTDKAELASILREIFGVSTEIVVDYINHNSKNICSQVEEKFSQLRKKMHQFYLPNILRNIIEEFQLVERIDILKIYPTKKIIEQYDTAMNIAYEIDSKNLGCRALEEKLKQSYQYAPIETTVDKDSVQLLTYHKSKGLEWPIVILPFIYRERKLSSADQSEIDNEKRMLFVACTRAKHRLILIDDSSCSPNTNHSNMISSGKFLDGII